MSHEQLIKDSVNRVAKCVDLRALDETPKIEVVVSALDVYHTLYYISCLTQEVMRLGALVRTLESKNEPT